MTGTACSDGDVCTTGDVCTSSGNCKSNGSLTCNDGNPCTTDGCDKYAGCFYQNATDGSTCGDGNSCTYADQCTAGVCGGTSPLVDNYENGKNPFALTNKSTCGTAGALTVMTRVANDDDLYSFTASGGGVTCGYGPQPKVALDNLSADLDLCVYASCNNGVTGPATVSCALGTKTQDATTGAWGCCSGATGLKKESASLTTDCNAAPLTNWSVGVLIRVEPVSGNTSCGSYELSWTAK